MSPLAVSSAAPACESVHPGRPFTSMAGGDGAPESLSRHPWFVGGGDGPRASALQATQVAVAHCPGGGCQSSILFPSGSITQPNFPYSESSVFSSTSQPSSRSACSSAARSATR